MADLGLHLDDLTPAHFRHHPAFGQTMFVHPLRIRTESCVAALAGCIGDTVWGVSARCRACLRRVAATDPSNRSRLPDNYLKLMLRNIR